MNLDRESKIKLIMEKQNAIDEMEKYLKGLNDIVSKQESVEEGLIETLEDSETVTDEKEKSKVFKRRESDNRL